MKKLLRSTIIIAALAGLPSISSAAVSLVQENFNYGGTAGTLTGASGGSGFSGNWAATGTPNGQYNPANLTSGATGYVNTVGSAGSYSSDGLTANLALGANFNVRNITSPDTYLATGGNDVWFSFLARVGATASQNVAQVGFSNSTGMFTNNQITPGISNGNFALHISGTPQALTGTAAINANQTYLVVGQFISGGTGFNDTVNVWFGSTDVSTTALLASTAQASISYTTLDFKPIANNFLDGIQLGVRDVGSSSNISALDSVRIAYGDTSAANFAAVIPEPSTYVALLGGIGMLALRRRRA